jgi:hypothetical protein
VTQTQPHTLHPAIGMEVQCPNPQCGRTIQVAIGCPGVSCKMCGASFPIVTPQPQATATPHDGQHTSQHQTTASSAAPTTDRTHVAPLLPLQNDIDGHVVHQPSADCADPTSTLANHLDESEVTASAFTSFPSVFKSTLTRLSAANSRPHPPIASPTIPLDPPPNGLTCSAVVQPNFLLFPTKLSPNPLLHRQCSAMWRGQPTAHEDPPLCTAGDTSFSLNLLALLRIAKNGTECWYLR